MVVNAKVVLIKLIKPLTWPEVPWRALAVPVLQEGSGVGAARQHSVRFHFRSAPVVTFMAEGEVDSLQQRCCSERKNSF